MSKRRVRFVQIALTQEHLKDLESNWELYDPGVVGVAFVELTALGFNLSMNEYGGQPQITAFAGQPSDDGAYLAVSASAPTPASALVALQFKVVGVAKGDLASFDTPDTEKPLSFS